MVISPVKLGPYILSSLVLIPLIEMETPSALSTVRFKKRKMESSQEEMSSLMDLSKEELIQKIVNLKQELNREKAKLVKDKVIKDSSKKKFDFSKVNMRPVALKVLYQGWNYHGFQIQSTEENTIAECLLSALQKTCLIESRENCQFVCCGRTDAGVSAFSQVVTLKVRSKLACTGTDSDDNELPYVKMLNSNMPRDIKVVAWSAVPEGFSARFDCLHRNYKYWFPQSGLNINAMNQAAGLLVGTHDFRNLCKMNVANGVVNFTREVTQASVRQAFHNSQFNDSEHSMCEFHIRSQGFLWHQIRCIMTVLFLVGQGKEKPDIVQHLCDIEKCPRKPVYPMARGEPLNLYETEFNPGALVWRYDDVEVSHLLRDLQEEWSRHSVRATMLGEMIRDTAVESKCTAGELHISHLIEGINPSLHIPLMSRQTCESLENRIQHYVKKKRIEILPLEQSTKAD